MDTFSLLKQKQSELEEATPAIEDQAFFDAGMICINDGTMTQPQFSERVAKKYGDRALEMVDKYENFARLREETRLLFNQAADEVDDDSVKWDCDSSDDEPLEQK